MKPKFFNNIAKLFRSIQSPFIKLTKSGNIEQAMLVRPIINPGQRRLITSLAFPLPVNIKRGEQGLDSRPALSPSSEFSGVSQGEV
jgi:hypothetical protein